MTYFLSGGSKSGKSMLAQKIAKALPAPHYYLATLRPTDAEDRAIVARHLRERDGWGFTTLERECGILSALELAPENGTFLLDSVTALLANEMFRRLRLFRRARLRRAYGRLPQRARTHRREAGAGVRQCRGAERVDSHLVQRRLAALKTQIIAFFMAWGMFLSIPCPCKIWDEKARPWQLVYLPVAGLLVGALWALAAYALGSFDRLPALRAAVLAALPFLLTGFLHLDGFMDCCDAILSRRDLPTRQKILKDSHVGSFAVVCTIFLMLAAFAAFWDFDAKEGWQGLLLLPVFSRFASSFCVFACRPMQTSQYASGFEAAQHKRQLTALAVLNVLAAAAGLLLLKSAWFTVSAIGAELFALLVCRAARKNLGGMSGDISGFSMTLGELAGLLLLLAGQGALWS